MTTKHTPGPWKVQDIGAKPGYPDWHEYAIRDARTNVFLAVVGNVDRYFEKNNHANAALIAAAPDLHKALQLILEVSDRNDFATYSLVVRELAADALEKVEQS